MDNVAELDITTLPVPEIGLETTFLLPSVNKACEAVAVDKTGAAEKVFAPANVCVPVVTSPLAVAEASGIFNVIVPLPVTGLPETFTSVPEVPVVKPTLVTVPVVLEVPAPMAVLKSEADKAVTVLFALNRGKVIAPGSVSVNKLFPMVVAPKLVLAPAAVVEPVPPFATSMVPVTFDAVPVVFWFNVGISAATKLRKDGAAAEPDAGPAKIKFAF